MRAIRVVISGRVQGVGYRAWVVKSAHALKLNGWVRNLESGQVEALFSGEESSVLALIEACKKGPPMARVDAIDSYAAAYAETASGFTQLPSA